MEMQICAVVFIAVRPIFYYRGDELMAVRCGLYKAHLWTFTQTDEVSKIDEVKSRSNVTLFVPCVMIVGTCSGSLLL